MNRIKRQQKHKKSLKCLDRRLLELVEGVSVVARLLSDEELGALVSGQQLRSGELDLPATNLCPVIGVVQEVVRDSPKEKEMPFHVRNSRGIRAGTGQGPTP